MIVRLASVEHEKVIEDIKFLHPEWEGKNECLKVENKRIDINPIHDRITQNEVVDEEGKVIEPVKFAGELRVDIILSVNYVKPVFLTEVYPKNPNMQYL